MASRKAGGLSPQFLLPLVHYYYSRRRRRRRRFSVSGVVGTRITV